jgi:hypothetical protein
MCVKGDSMELLILHRESPWKTATWQQQSVLRKKLWWSSLRFYVHGWLAKNLLCWITKQREISHRKNTSIHDKCDIYLTFVESYEVPGSALGAGEALLERLERKWWSKPCNISVEMLMWGGDHRHNGEVDRWICRVVGGRWGGFSMGGMVRPGHGGSY